MFNSGSKHVIPRSLEKPIIKALKTDDIQSFIMLLTNLSNVDSYYNNAFMINDYLLCSSPPLCSLAAYYGARNCLQQLINAGCNLKLKDNLGSPISYFAIASGSFEILFLLSNYNVVFDTDSLFVAADSGNFNIFIWIYASQPVDLLTRKADRSCLLHHAVKGKSYKLVKFLLKEIESFLDVRDLQDAIIMIKNLQEESCDEEDDETQYVSGKIDQLEDS